MASVGSSFWDQSFFEFLTGFELEFDPPSRVGTKNTVHPLVLAFDKQYKGSPKQLILASMTLENILGQGSRASAYRIPQMPAYVLHVKSGFVLEQASNLRLSLQPDPLPERNIGQVVATLDAGEAVHILRYQIGVTYQIPYADIFQKYDIDDLLGHGKPAKAEDIAPYGAAYAEHLARVAAMPQAAYDELAVTIGLLPQCGLFLDPCSLNILVDETRQSFNTLDHLEPIGPYENVLGMACALMDTMFVDLDEHMVLDDVGEHRIAIATDPALMALRQKIMVKTLWAGYRMGLKLPQTPCPKNIFGFHQRSFDMEYALKISGMAHHWPAIKAMFAAKTTGRSRLSKSMFQEKLAA